MYCKLYPKTSSSYFKYYVDDVLYENKYGRCPDNYNKKINKFFIIYYSSKDPNKIIVNLDNEVTDSIKILKAGFSRNDLKN